MAAQHFEIREWERFQPADREAPWAKLHSMILDDYTWLKWSDDAKLLAVAVAMLAARLGNRIPWDRDQLATMTHVAVSERAMQELQDSGFVSASKDRSNLVAFPGWRV